MRNLYPKKNNSESSVDISLQTCQSFAFEKTILMMQWTDEKKSLVKPRALCTNQVYMYIYTYLEANRRQDGLDRPVRQVRIGFLLSSTMRKRHIFKHSPWAVDLNLDSLMYTLSCCYLFNSWYILFFQLSRVFKRGHTLEMHTPWHTICGKTTVERILFWQKIWGEGWMFLLPLQTWLHKQTSRDRF